MFFEQKFDLGLLVYESQCFKIFLGFKTPSQTNKVLKFAKFDLSIKFRPTPGEFWRMFLERKLDLVPLVYESQCSKRIQALKPLSDELSLEIRKILHLKKIAANFR